MRHRFFVYQVKYSVHTFWSFSWLTTFSSQIFLHGNNLNSLHQLIHPEFLPSEFGGTLPPYDMGTWARTLLGPDYSDENDYTHTSYNAMHVKHTSSNLERECSPKMMKR